MKKKVNTFHKDKFKYVEIVNNFQIVTLSKKLLSSIISVLVVLAKVRNNLKQTSSHLSSKLLWCGSCKLQLSNWFESFQIQFISRPEANRKQFISS